MAQNSIDNKIVNAILARSNTSSGQWDSYDDGTDEFGFYNFAGSPEGNVTANIGSLAVDTSNGAAYIKTTDSADTGWSELLTSSTSSGEVVQYKFTSTSTSITTTSQIPQDDTPPTSSEGVEILSLAITPKSATNILWITGKTFYNVNGSGQGTVFLLTDGSTDSIAAVPGTAGTSTVVFSDIVAGGTSAITVSMRGGPNSAFTANFNQTGGGASIFGTAGISSLTVMEIQA